MFGVKEGLENCPYNALVTQEVKDAVDQAFKDFEDGKIEAPSTEVPLGFEIVLLPFSLRSLPAGEKNPKTSGQRKDYE